MGRGQGPHLHEQEFGRTIRGTGGALLLLTREGRKKERKKTDNPREGWEDGTPPPHRDFKERGVMR